LPAIRARQAARENLPGERYADSAYISGEHIVDGRTLGEELVGPMRETVTPQSKLPDGLTQADFHIHGAARAVSCPNGHTTQYSPPPRTVATRRSSLSVIVTPVHCARAATWGTARRAAGRCGLVATMTRPKPRASVSTPRSSSNSMRVTAA